MDERIQKTGCFTSLWRWLRLRISERVYSGICTYNYSESHIVNLVGIRRKDYVLIWGGLTDVWIYFSINTE